MKFRTGFVLGVAAGAWAVNKASALQRGHRSSTTKGPTSEETAEKLRAISGLAKERLSDLVEGPLGEMARDRLTALIGTSLGGSAGSGNDRHSNGGGGRSTIDTTARWPR